MAANRIQDIVRVRRSVTADTALLLSEYFGHSAEFWLNPQQSYELEQAKREEMGEIEAQAPQRRPPRKELETEVPKTARNR